MKPVELKLVSGIISRLDKRISFLLTSFAVEEQSNKLQKDFDLSPEIDEHNLNALKQSEISLDCHEVQKEIRKVLRELNEFGTYECLTEIVNEYKDIDRRYEEHEKILMEKEQEIQELREVLSEESNLETTGPNESLNLKDQLENHSKSLNRLTDVEKLMAYKIKSKRNHYEDVFKNIHETVKWHERETQTQYHADVQSISFWLLKFEIFTKNMDLLLRKTFDEWALKARQLAILKKYRKLNLEKIKKVTIQIEERDRIIENYREEKLAEKARILEEFKINSAATTIQAYWKGTMVRKHLGPFKIKKSKKGKGKKK